MKLFSVEIPKKIILIAVLVSFLAQVPNIYAWLRTPEGYWFSGFNSYFSPVDVNTYLATMRQGFSGNWLWQNRYTVEAVSSYSLYTSYLFLGHLARLGRLPLPFVFHLSSFVLSVIFLLVIYVLVTHFLEEKKLRYFCFFLIALGGGVGWAALQSSPDVLHREVLVFSTLNLPHFVLDQLLFILTLYFGFLGIRQRNIRLAGISAVSGLLLSAIHPYSLVVVSLVLGGYVFLSGIIKGSFLVRLKFLSPLLIANAISLAFFAYLFYFRADPVLQEWMRQQVIPSPSPPVFFFGYGLLSVLGLFGLWYLWEKRNEESLFLLSWIVLHLSVIYLPVRFQLLMIKGFFIALCLLATFGVKKLSFLKTENIILILVLSMLTPLTLQILHMTALEERSRLVYLTAGEGDSFSWVRGNVPPDSLFLSSYIVGNFLPAQTDSRVYFGHGIFTTRFDQKKKLVDKFYGDKMSREERGQFLDDGGIDYVFCGPEENRLGSDCLFADLNLSKVYENEKIKIFKVKEL